MHAKVSRTWDGTLCQASDGSRAKPKVWVSFMIMETTGCGVSSDPYFAIPENSYRVMVLCGDRSILRKSRKLISCDGFMRWSVMASDSMRWNYISQIWWSMVVITPQTKSLAMVILIWVTYSTLEAQVYPKADWPLRIWYWSCVEGQYGVSEHDGGLESKYHESQWCMNDGACMI